jgi:biopolymer transport protein ExbB/TolQ
MLAQIAKFFVEGGAFMWVILIVLAVAAAVTIERLIFYYYTCRNDAQGLVAAIARALNAGDTAGARMASAGSAPLDRIALAAVEGCEKGFTFPDIKKIMEQRAIKELPRFAQRLNYISLFANIATLLGLMGTIFGLIISFGSISSVEASQKSAMLAKGISQAMNTTAFGLIVAVPCMVVYTIFQNRQAALAADLDEAIVKLLHYLEKKQA